jgi:cysteinyl-tRNA synthetase
MTVWDIAKKYEERFLRYISQLGIEPFDAMPRATDYIKEQIEIVDQLTQSGYTYVIPYDGIYMDTSRVEGYGKLL